MNYNHDSCYIAATCCKARAQKARAITCSGLVAALPPPISLGLSKAILRRPDVHNAVSAGGFWREDAHTIVGSGTADATTVYLMSNHKYERSAVLFVTLARFCGHGAANLDGGGVDVLVELACGRGRRRGGVVGGDDQAK